MRQTTTRVRFWAAAVVAGSVLLVTFTGAEAEPQPEKICRGQDPDADCQVGPPTGTTDGHNPAADALTAGHDERSSNADLTAASLAAAVFQDVAQAEAAGYASTLDTLGCFEDGQRGGMGLHYANDELMDATLDVTKPEALVYELDATGQITALVAHEYIVPIEAWDDAAPPRLFGRDLHQHPSLPVWILHTWIWKNNPMGMFEDFNPRVRPCPEGILVYGE
jgi:hypothetical protein